MYWPIGTPRIYATSSGRAPELNLFVSYDGLQQPDGSSSSSYLGQEGQAQAPAGADLDDVDIPPPATPLTPATPGVQSVEQDEYISSAKNLALSTDSDNQTAVPLKDPVLALRVARTGHIFGVITALSITLWQTKPTVILAVVVRSESSIQSYGTNVDLLLRPDSAILVVQTSKGYLITYSIATDGESCVYKPQFPNYHNVQRRKQSLIGSQAGLKSDHILWGPGEGSGVRDVSVRFRMVIKIDAGIESALALDDELMVATRKPAAVQCIRWTPDNTGNQTRTELVSKMGWIEKKSSIVEMTYDRPMNLATWITSDGRAYAVQRQAVRVDADVENVDAKRLFKGHCFHTPETPDGYAVKTVINARFSLIAVGCIDGSVYVYSVRDYSGNIALSHKQSIPVSTAASGGLTSLCYSPDGYCLFAGFEKGWSTWSMFGKLGSNSFGADPGISNGNGEQWLSGISSASWIGGGSEILLAGPKNEAIWSLEMAKNAVTGCYHEANVFRTVLQTPTTVMIYRGYDLPDMTSISAEPFLWHTSKIPSNYLLNQWPIRQTSISPDGRYVAVAGRRGLAHYSVNSGRWKTFATEEAENEFQVRGGMCWYQHILIAAVESNRTYELRLFSRETALDMSQVLFRQQIPAPIVLVTTSGEDSLLVYTYENLLYHFIFSPSSDSVRLVQVGQIAFHGIVRSPARVRGLSWILPENQIVDGDPSQDVAVASVIFLVDGKLVLLSPSLNDEGQLKYDMRIIAQNVEYHASMRDQPLLNVSHLYDDPSMRRGPPSLKDSLWVFDGMEIKAWTNINEVLEAASADAGKDLPVPVSVPVDFYPLSVLLEKGIVLGVESDLVQRRDVTFSFFHFAIRSHLFLPDVLRFYLRRSRTAEAGELCEQYQSLEYLSHGLEILLHRVLDEEADTCPKPEDAVLPRVLSLLSSSKEYLDVVLQCTRKTEVRQWKTLFAYLPPAQELFEESLQRGSLKTAGGYLIVLHTLDELESSTDQSVRVLSRAIQEGDWELCKELARFLAAMDEKGEVLKEVMQMVNMGQKHEQNHSDMRSHLEIPVSKGANGAGRRGSREVEDMDETESDAPSASDVSSVGSTASPFNGYRSP
ncbi:WD40 repeat protein [Conoideocrella luteorostrata]|uniref:WD40 repeat protein n=1 Tax=Conoideocrella luteorostrata TaxID=1105319 RepID=A0AAJ0CHR4_9HYPO|nr:WD40 repeat protein [Conoideocrella luteorostrata]